MSLRSEKLDKQLSSLIQKVSLPKDWAEELNRLALQDYKNSAPSPSLTACVKESETKLSVISQKLERLLNGYLDQIIDREDYRLQKGKLLSEKKSLEEEICNLSHKQNDWLEPMKEWIKDAQSLDKIASDSDLFAKKVCAKEIFGSNLLLGEKSVRASAPKILNSFGKFGGNPWDALRASHLLALKKPLSSVLVPRVGVEPTSLARHHFKWCAYTNSAIRAFPKIILTRFLGSTFTIPLEPTLSKIAENLQRASRPPKAGRRVRISPKEKARHAMQTHSATNGLGLWRRSAGLARAEAGSGRESARASAFFVLAGF